MISSRERSSMRPASRVSIAQSGSTNSDRSADSRRRRHDSVSCLALRLSPTCPPASLGEGHLRLAVAEIFQNNGDDLEAAAPLTIGVVEREREAIGRHHLEEAGHPSTPCPMGLLSRARRQVTKRSGSVHALKTSSRGASKTRTITTPSASPPAGTTRSGA